MSKRLPKWVYKTVQTLCVGYTARANAITFGEVRGNVKTEYERLNHSIDDSLREVFDDDMALVNIFRRDIAGRTGWQFSMANDCFSRHAYDSRKNKAVYTIAKTLHLL